MTGRTFRLLAAAEDEANEAFDWYQSERLGLGDDFRGEVKLTLQRILSGPLQFGIVIGLIFGVQGFHRFPFSIFFRVENGAILIFSVFHEKRDPAIWHGRID